MDDDLKAFIARVEAFEIDADHKALRFVDRLARENRWTIGYASRVVREYLRFCILAMRCGHPVTPSEEVDQAWHLHLTYTRSYWERFCRQTLGGPLHHEPTAGGVAEGNKFRDWYQATLDSYRRVFGSDPPQDIWPPVEQRLAHAGELKWMNASREWAVPKRLVVVGGGVLACCVATIASQRMGEEGDRPHSEAATSLAAAFFPFDLGGPAFLLFYASLGVLGFAVILTLVIAAAVREEHEEHEVRSKTVDELSTDELAVLAGGGSRLAHVALTRLFAEGRIEATKTLWWYNRFRISGPPPAQPAIDRELYTAIESGTSPSGLMKVVKPYFKQIEARLVEKGLRYPSGQKSKAATWVAVSISLLGGLRLIQGLALGEEVGYLILMIVAFVVVALVTNVRWVRLTPEGKSYFNTANATFESKSATAADLDPAELATKVALLGVSAVAGIEGLAPLAAVAPSVGGGAASTGCGSGCGGGGCGGGGCGGCGG